MANYKGIEVDPAVRPLLPHMAMVEEYREALQTLQAVWDNLNLLGQLSGTTAEMGRTRQAFASLTGDLLNNLAERTLAKRAQEMSAKAQMVIDILIRNLFERTADIGFLATDDDIRRAAATGQTADLPSRFEAYVAKYSVYEDIVLLAPDGAIKVRLQAGQAVDRVDESWVGEALNTQQAYIERYGRSALLSDRKPALIYAYRVSSASGQPLGVLALCFRFTDEMQRIFRSLSQAGDAGVLALLDCNSQVIASSDRWQVPLGAEISLPRGGLQRLRFAGRSYLAVACQTKGYQGYSGPGWRGLVMLPLEQAFEFLEDEAEQVIAEPLLPSILAGGRAFPASLQAIPRQADTIQRDLNRSVWNGTVRHSSDQGSTATNPAFSKILLWEISRTATRMREVFAQSIGNLQTTVLSSLLADCSLFAALAIDIMDRNLYERANDCRWWALDPAMRRLLATGVGESRRNGLSEALRYINDLYTVYDNLLVFDAAGVVVAVSNSAYDGLIGKRLDEPWVASCLALDDGQQYAVTPFAASHLYGGRPTYSYLAALRAPDSRTVVGGMAIVFDSARQFAAMLTDALPHEASGEVVAGSFALFVDGEGRVIASSDPSYAAGQSLSLPAALLDPPATGHAELIEFAGQVMAVGARRSTGYREYKGPGDRYRNSVTALIFMPLGAFNPAARLSAEAAEVGSHCSLLGQGQTIEIASFYLGDYWLGLPVTAVVEAVERSSTARLANAPPQVYGAFMYRGDTLPLYNLHAALGLPPPVDDGAHCQVVVIRNAQAAAFGILVDALGAIPEVAVADVADVSSIYVGVTPVLASVVKVSDLPAAPMLTLLSVDSMARCLRA
ncbi:MAG: chemotaxis protein CheW [Dechloromonas sp.]|nr:chemotaxis protein CheW [Dechloromonas sp.]